MGIALLPVAAGVSLSLAGAMATRVNLPEGVLRAERVAKQLLEVVEDCIFKKEIWGGGLVWFGFCKNALDYHAH